MVKIAMRQLLQVAEVLRHDRIVQAFLLQYLAGTSGDGRGKRTPRRGRIMKEMVNIE